MTDGREARRHRSGTAVRRPERAGMLESSFTFLRVRGIPIGAHWSWLFVFALVTWVLGSQLFPRTYPGLGPRVYWVMAVVASVMFFGSVLLHELGHALTAMGHRMHIEGITLWLFGGVARFSEAFPSPGAEFRIAMAGPAISLALAAVFGGLAYAGNALDWAEPARGVLDYLGRINLVVLLFNLVPALPLDGGRALRAWLWRRQGSFEAATVSAARAGQVFGVVLIAIGVLGFFTGSGTGGLWFAFIGWFLLQAAQGEAVHAVLRGRLQGLRVRDAMTPDPQVVSPDVGIGDVLERARSARNPSAYPVVEDGRLAGFISLRAAAQVPPEERDRTRVGDAMVPAGEVATLSPEDPLETALQALQQREARRAVVVEEDSVVGILSMSDLARTMEVRRLEGGPRAARRVGILPWTLVALVLALAASLLYRPPVAVLAPGVALDVARDITITGIETHPVRGRYLLTSVSLSQPTALGALVALFHPDRDVVSLSAVIPPGVDPGNFLQQQREIFRESRMVAAAAAADAAGMEVAVSGEGAQVVQVLENAPADGLLQPGDLIVAVEGRRVRLASDAVDEIRSHPPGTRLEFVVERDGDRRSLTVRSARLRRESLDIVGVGISVRTQNVSFDLPFEVKFRDREVGGPSAGLAYALAVADLLSAQDLARGRTIAATGTIDLTGGVGEVGGVGVKAEAVEDREAVLFLVPAGDVPDAAGEGVPVRGVETLREALEVLRG